MPVSETARKIWNNVNSRLRIVGFILVVLAVGSTFQIFYTNQVRRDLMQCQVQFMDQTITALEQRSKSSNEASEALEALITGLKDSSESNYTERLYDEYLRKRDEQKKSQVENPYPTIKLSDVCYRE